MSRIFSMITHQQLTGATLLISFFLIASGFNKPSGISAYNAGTNKGFIRTGKNVIFCSGWKEFEAAAANAAPGDVLQLKNGVYSGNITFSKSGTKDEPITIIAESPGSVIINGNSKWVIDGKYITLDGFYFKEGISTNPVTFTLASGHSRFLNSAIIGWNLGSAQDTRLVTVMGTNNEVSHCVLRAKDTPGMMLEVVRHSPMRNDHNINHVYFGYFKDPGSGNGFETVRISTSGYSLSSSYTTLENCVFERCDGESEIISSKSGHNTFRNNTFLNSDGALTLRHGHDALVEGNYFINTLDKTSSRCNGVRVIGERQVVRNNYFLNLPLKSPAIQIEYGNTIPHKLTFYDQVKDAMIENNTIYNCDKGISIGVGMNLKMAPPRIMAPNGIFKNNLIVNNKGDNASLEISAGVLSEKLFTYSDNIFSGKKNTSPSAESLPEGIRYIDTLTMTGVNGLFFPYNNATTGVQNKTIKPFQQLDIAPDWIKAKMNAKDPDFVGILW
jgi:poly(beta-D-mannuronate) lyase